MNFFALTQVGFGAGLEAVSRVLVSNYMNKNLATVFLVEILLVNIGVAFLIGLIMGIFVNQATINPSLILIFLVHGFFSGFTTFSSFSFEALLLFQAGKFYQALTYISFAIFGCLLGVYLGALLVR